jgi:hypothetical protein
VLGIVRKRYEVNGVLFEHITQAGFLNEFWEEFKHLFPDNPKPPAIPFPKNTRLCAGYEDATDTELKELAKDGHANLVGGLI